MKHSRFMNKIIKAMIISSFAVICGTTVISCASTPKEVPYEATSREIIQLAQTEYDAGRISNALFYYETLIMRYGSDTAVYVEARYEIGHIYFKQKRYREAAAIFTEILDIYNSLQPGEIPGSFKKLAQNDLSKIPEEYLSE